MTGADNAKIVVRPVDSLSTDSGTKIRTYGDSREDGNAPYDEPPENEKSLVSQGKIASKKMEAATRIELVCDGFANHCLIAVTPDKLVNYVNRVLSWTGWGTGIDDNGAALILNPIEATQWHFNGAVLNKCSIPACY